MIERHDHHRPDPALCTVRQLIEQLRSLGLEGDELEDTFFEILRSPSQGIRVVGPSAGNLVAAASRVN